MEMKVQSLLGTLKEFFSSSFIQCTCRLSVINVFYVTCGPSLIQYKCFPYQRALAYTLAIMLFYINFVSGTVHLIHWKSIEAVLHFSVDDNWSGLTQALSGQFCASLNFIDSKSTTSPKLSFRREGVAFNADHLNSSLLRHAALAREIVCTENLTPWKKLLPCDSKVHFSILLRTIYLFYENRSSNMLCFGIL